MHFCFGRNWIVTPFYEVLIGEALGLLSVLKCVNQLYLGPIDFELDAKKVVNNFSSAYYKFWDDYP